jgi:uncharacterized membrane protein YkvA (DUF1232 family)
VHATALELLAGAALGLLAAWGALVALLVALRPSSPFGAGEALRLVPDLVRLVRRLAADRSLPLRARVPLWLLVVYLAVPIDLVPDFLPVIGYADDVILVAAALRLATRRAGGDAIRRHWPGTPGGLAAVLRLAGIAA